MSVARWSSRFDLTVSRDVDSVVAWYRSPERRAEARAHFESFDVRDFVDDERIEGDRRITEMSWVTPAGLHVFLEIRGTVWDGSVVPDANGTVTLRGETYQYRRWPDGREDRSRGQTVAEFSAVAGGGTRVRLILSRQKDAASWWECWLPPVAERQGQRRQLKEMFARCERDLGGSPP